MTYEQILDYPQITDNGRHMLEGVNRGVNLDDNDDVVHYLKYKAVRDQKFINYVNELIEKDNIHMIARIVRHCNSFEVRNYIYGKVRGVMCDVLLKAIRRSAYDYWVIPGSDIHNNNKMVINELCTGCRYSTVQYNLVNLNLLELYPNIIIRIKSEPKQGAMGYMITVVKSTIDGIEPKDYFANILCMDTLFEPYLSGEFIVLNPKLCNMNVSGDTVKVKDTVLNKILDELDNENKIDENHWKDKYFNNGVLTVEYIEVTECLRSPSI